MISIIPARTGIHALANLRCRLEIYLLQRLGVGRRLKAKDFNRGIQLQRTQQPERPVGLASDANSRIDEQIYPGRRVIPTLAAELMRIACEPLSLTFVPCREINAVLVAATRP